jgi:hypothetical protein
MLRRAQAVTALTDLEPEKTRCKVDKGGESLIFAPANYNMPYTAGAVLGSDATLHPHSTEDGSIVSSS